MNFHDQPAPRRYALDEGECRTCDEDRHHGGPKPPHDASRRCQSGGHTHCTCDRCF